MLNIYIIYFSQRAKELKRKGKKKKRERETAYKVPKCMGNKKHLAEDIIVNGVHGKNRYWCSQLVLDEPQYKLFSPIYHH